MTLRYIREEKKKKKDLEGLILNKNSRNKNLLFIPKKIFYRYYESNTIKILKNCAAERTIVLTSIKSVVLAHSLPFQVKSFCSAMI